MFRQGTHLGRCSLRLRRHQQGAPKKVKSQWYGPGMKWIFMHVSCRYLLWSGFKNMVRVIVNFICKQLVFLTFKPRDSKGFISVGEPLFLTPLVEAGKLEEAREASKVFFLPVLEKWRCIFLKTDAQVVLPQAPLLPRWLERFDGLYFSEIWVGQLTTWESAYLMDP